MTGVGEMTVAAGSSGPLLKIKEATKINAQFVSNSAEALPSFPSWGADDAAADVNSLGASKLFRCSTHPAGPSELRFLVLGSWVWESLVLVGWLLVGWLSVVGWLVVGWLVVSCWLVGS